MSSGSHSLPYSLPCAVKNSAWESRNSHHLITQRVTTTQEPTACARIRADIWRQSGTICSKKIVPYHRCARILRHKVSVSEYGSWCTRNFSRTSWLTPECFIFKGITVACGNNSYWLPIRARISCLLLQCSTADSWFSLFSSISCVAGLAWLPRWLELAPD